MFKYFKQFIFRETILAATIVLIGYFLFTGALKEYYRNIIPVLLLILYIITAAIHGFLLNAGARDSQKFVRRFMIASGLKLLLFLLIIVVYLLVNREDAIIFLSAFLSFYLIFTVFEVFSILKVLKKNIRD